MTEEEGWRADVKDVCGVAGLALTVGFLSGWLACAWWLGALQRALETAR